MSAKLKMICRTCKSEDVLSDAYAKWDFENQKWIVQNTFDKGAWCNKCDGETRIDELEIPDGQS